MTDARFPDRWLSDRRLQRLSDSHFRAFITSLAWSVSNRTDGVIEPEDLALIPNFSANAVKAFVDAGLWSPLVTGWFIKDYPTTQTSREQLAANEQQRAKEREKKARQRAAKKAAAGSTNTDVPGDIPRDVPRENPGQDRPGQDRRSKGDHSAKSADESSTNNVAELPLAAGAEWPRWQGSGPNPFLEHN